jgi:hypothetical protein
MENERKRIETHQDYQILDTVSENFRRPGQTHCHYLRCISMDGVSVSNVSRVDTERLWEKREMSLWFISICVAE